MMMMVTMPVLPLPPGSVHAHLPVVGAAEWSEESSRHRGRPVQVGHQVSLWVPTCAHPSVTQVRP